MILLFIYIFKLKNKMFKGKVYIYVDDWKEEPVVFVREANNPEEFKKIIKELNLNLANKSEQLFYNAFDNFVDFVNNVKVNIEPLVWKVVESLDESDKKKKNFWSIEERILYYEKLLQQKRRKEKEKKKRIGKLKEALRKLEEYLENFKDDEKIRSQIEEDIKKVKEEIKNLSRR